MNQFHRFLAAGAAALMLGTSASSTLAAPSSAPFCGDATPCIRVQDVTVTEANSGLHQAMFHITIGPASIARTTVQYKTTSGSASAGSDFVSQSGSIVFDKGETRKTVIVSVRGDTIDEANEKFYLDLTGTNFGQIVDSRGTATIVDNDTSGNPGNPPTPPACPPSLPNCHEQ
jgi:hypothetical protein